MSLSKINGNHSSQSNSYNKYEIFYAKQVNLINEIRSAREFPFLYTSIFFFINYPCKCRFLKRSIFMNLNLSLYSNKIIKFQSFEEGVFLYLSYCKKIMKSSHCKTVCNFLIYVARSGQGHYLFSKREELKHYIQSIFWNIHLF